MIMMVYSQKPLPPNISAGSLGIYHSFDRKQMYLHFEYLEFQTLPFASGQALARGILDSLMSTTYFNASALR